MNPIDKINTVAGRVCQPDRQSDDLQARRQVADDGPTNRNEAVPTAFERNPTTQTRALVFTILFRQAAGGPVARKLASGPVSNSPAIPLASRTLLETFCTEEMLHGPAGCAKPSLGSSEKFEPGMLCCALSIHPGQDSCVRSLLSAVPHPTSEAFSPRQPRHCPPAGSVLVACVPLVFR